MGWLTDYNGWWSTKYTDTDILITYNELHRRAYELLGYSILIPYLVEAMDKQLPMVHFYWHVNMLVCTKGFLYKNIETGKVSIIYVGSLIELIYGKEACAMYDCQIIDRIYKKEKLCHELIKYIYSLGIVDTYVGNFLLV